MNYETRYENDLKPRLERLAYRQSRPFCYGCYELWRFFNAGEWEKARKLLSDDFEAFWPQSRERIIGPDNFIELNRRYPGEHKIQIVNSMCEYDQWDMEFAVSTQVYIESKMPDGKEMNPPGTSKWNKIEHRLFCHITRNWRGRPLETLEIVVNLIGATKTKEGLEVQAWLDSQRYEKGLKITDDELAEVRIKRDKFHGDWNYEIYPANLYHKIR